MKWSLSLVLLWTSLLVFVASFSPEGKFANPSIDRGHVLIVRADHEIFRLRDELEAIEGPDVTFYSTFIIRSRAPLVSL